MYIGDSGLWYIWSSSLFEELCSILSCSCVPLCLAAIHYSLFSSRINFLGLLKWWFCAQSCHKHFWRLHQWRVNSDYFFNTAFLIPIVWLFGLLFRTCMRRRHLNNLRLLGFQRCPLDCNINLIWWFGGRVVFIFKYGLYIRFECVRHRALCVFLVPEVTFDNVPVHFVHFH